MSCTGMAKVVVSRALASAWKRTATVGFFAAPAVKNAISRIGRKCFTSSLIENGAPMCKAWERRLQAFGRCVKDDAMIRGFAFALLALLAIAGFGACAKEKRAEQPKPGLVSRSLHTLNPLRLWPKRAGKPVD